MTKEGIMHAIMTMSSPDGQGSFELIQSAAYIYMKEPEAEWIRTNVVTTDLPDSVFDPNLFQGIFDDPNIPWEFVTVEALGSELVRGVQAEHVLVQVDLLALMQAQLQKLHQDMEDLGELGALVGGLFEDQVALIPNYDIEMWVDMNGIVRKQRVQMSIGTEMAVTMNAEIFDINEDIIVLLPTDYVDSSEGNLRAVYGQILLQDRS